MWRFFKTRILRRKTTHKTLPDGMVKIEGETIIQNEDGTYTRITETKLDTYDALPAEIRHEMIRQGTNTAELDEREVFEKKIRLRAAETEDFLEEMAMAY